MQAMFPTLSRALIMLVFTAAAAACGYPRPPDVADDGGPGDAPDPGSTLRVSPSGDDANDGLRAPVKTLKRAIAIAGTNMEIKTIALGAGRYAATSGETFPYLVPAAVTITGASEGVAVLVGDNAQDGLVVDTGRIQNLELDNFSVAIRARHNVELSGTHIKDSLLAVHGETSAALSIKQLEVIGSVNGCGSGIRLEENSELDVDILVERNLSSAVRALASSMIKISKADIVGDPRCDCLALEISTGQTFELTDSIVVGCRVGLTISGRGSSQTRAAISNTTLRNTENAISVGSGTMLQVIGGELSNNTRAAVAFFGGSGNFVNVKITENSGSGVFVLGAPTVGVATISMRGCTVTGNNFGVFFFDMSAGDLGTPASPGNNVLQSNQMVGISVQGAVGPEQVDAVGNIWNPDIQEANPAGTYPNVKTVPGPVVSVSGNNYDIASGLSLRR